MKTFVTVLVIMLTVTVATPVNSPGRAAGDGPLATTVPTCFTSPANSFVQAGSCDDYSVVCEDVAYREMTFCDFYGLGDCFCKGQRAYNQCMKNANCPGLSAETMRAQGCGCLNKSCVP